MADKKTLNLFIDTNILLDFYRFSEADLEKLVGLEELIDKTNDINLLVTSHQVDEFYRRRDKVIADAIKELKTAINIPKLFSGHMDYAKITKQASSVRIEIERVRDETLEAAKQGQLKTDIIIERLFKNAMPIEEDVIKKAQRRLLLGNPPGKKNTIGDAVNWEQLLSTIPEDQDLHIVSQDSDFASEIDRVKINSFLQREWNKTRFGKVHYYAKLNSFFEAHLPNIKLLDEYVKDDLIRQLEQSRSFDSSRDIIEKMVRKGSFTRKQAIDTFIAACDNFQVYGAHQYSPELVGDKLIEIIKPYWNDLGIEAQSAWSELFADPETYDQELA